MSLMPPRQGYHNTSTQLVDKRKDKAESDRWIGPQSRWDVDVLARDGQKATWNVERLHARFRCRWAPQRILLCTDTLIGVKDTQKVLLGCL